MKHIVSVGGGISSTVLLPYYLFLKYPKEQIELVTCHLPNEDKDVFRLIEVVENKFDTQVKKIGLNKTPFDIFFSSKFLGNSRIDPCSKQLKRDVMKNYIKENYNPDEIILHIGIGQDEIDRTLSIKKNWKELGYTTEFPLIDYNFNRANQLRFCQSFIGFVPRLYLMGFSHNNCGGACIKAGKKEWARLLWFLPEVYLDWESNENKFRELHGDYTILRENRKGVKVQLSLTELRQRLEPYYINNDNTLKGFEQIMKTRGIRYLELDDNLTGCNFCDAMA